MTIQTHKKGIFTIPHSDLSNSWWTKSHGIQIACKLHVIYGNFISIVVIIVVEIWDELCLSPRPKVVRGSYLHKVYAKYILHILFDTKDNRRFILEYYWASKP